jgi:hypothetical protein
MSRCLLVICACVCALYTTAGIAKKPENPPQEPAVAPPEIYSVKIDYINGFVIAEGVELSPGTATATFAGVNLTTDPASTDVQLLFPFTTELESAVNELGNYVLVIATDGGGFTLSAFVPFALTIPPPPPPPGPDCPCSTEWDLASTTASPNGFSGLTPYCSEDTSSFVTVQFYDLPVANYWVLWTGWDAGSSTGYCELYIDGPNRILDNEAQFDACAAYLRNIVTVWGNQGNMCIF